MVQLAKRKKESQVGSKSSEVRECMTVAWLFNLIVHEPWSVCQGTSSALQSCVWSVPGLAHVRLGKDSALG